MATTRQVIQGLNELTSCIRRLPGFDEVIRTLQSGGHAGLDGTWGSACALTSLTLAEDASGPVIIVLPRIADVDDFALDVANFGDISPEVFPAWATMPEEQSIGDAVFGGRLRILQAVTGSEPPSLIVTSLPALLQPVPSAKSRTAGTRRLHVGLEVESDDLMKWLIERGFDRVPALEAPGEFSMHGGILDLFPPDAVDPYRIEFFGDEIESIRRFDVETQRKLEDLDAISLTVITPEAGDDSSLASFLDDLPESAWIGLVELPDMVQEGHAYLDRLGQPPGLFDVEPTLAKVRRFSTATLSAIGDAIEDVQCQLQIESIEKFSGPRSDVLLELASALGPDETVLLACHNEGEQRRLSEMLAELDSEIAARIQLCLGRVGEGFRLGSENLVVLSDAQLFGRTDVRRAPRRKRRHADSRALDTFLDLRPGDLVVHLSHGIGRFRGMEILEKDDQAEEHLAIEFADSVRILVPVSLIHLVQKYVGAAKSIPSLSKLGGKTWAKKKEKAAESVRDMAADMIRLQAAREAKPGFACPPDSDWVNEFAAAFPYVETEDQDHAIAECKADLMRSRPMDRLICGDVGFGKTEVAMRAAFKMVDAGKQVAILVPTTVLAEQHFRSFCERMAEFPVSIDVLSRFRSKRQQREILERMATGSVDIVIGTHRIVQKDIRFRDLGLLIIDEEQRFGVDHKEMLKRMRLEVDVLTLSATPIPRTLHMAVLGIRDISNLTTAPQDRVPIETRISRFDEHLIRSAIVRELNRGGQVYFVHNRVYNIQRIADRIQKIVPEANIGIGHGQMSGDELETVMFDFVSGKLDVLVATTIIESGLDIPNANTIFIHQADKYGLADLHQLRGRVGRYKHRAYCYLLLEEGKPLTSDATKRLKAIEEYSELGSGFRIAMRDLEIRGAGNILGNEQSGHIASVGYELYCQLLENAVHRLKGEPIREHVHVNTNLPVSAFIPQEYIPHGRQKIEMYRKLSAVQTFDELASIKDEFRDRFGPIPEPTLRLIAVRNMQLLAAGWGIADIRLEDRFAVLGYSDRDKINVLKQRIGSDLRVVDHLSAYLVLPDLEIAGDPLVEFLSKHLRLK